MNILVTGGHGFIGKHLVESLVQDGHNVIIFDNLLEQVHGKDYKPPNKGPLYTNMDVSDLASWEYVLTRFRPTVIFHLAAETGTGQSMDDISRYTSTNILGTANMLELVNKKEYGVEKVILASSRAVYGDNVNDVNFSQFANPVSVYGLSKLTQEKLIEIGCKIPYTIFRYQNVYGPGQSISNPYTGIISIFSERFKNGKSVDIWDKGAPTRDFIFVKDVVEATKLGLKILSNYKTYDVGTGESFPIIEIAE